MIDVQRNGRVAEGTPLLRVQTGKNRSRGFESLLLRHFYFSQQAEPHEIFYYFFLTRLENDGSCES